MESVRIRLETHESPSRWLWLVKWCVLAVPHYPILIALYLMFPLLTVVAGVFVLCTGRYPRPLFEVAVGVFRWSWRVMCYRFPMNSTDQYPPFTLAMRADYPGDLEVDYPERLTRWTVLVKWLFAIPHLLILGAMWPLLQALCVGAAIGLLITGSVPKGMFDFLMGICLWRYRVAIYFALMRDEYPPFRLDQ